MLNPQFLVEERKQFLGGSDIGVLMGANPYKTPYQLFLEKRGELPPEEENDAMRWGTAFEEFIRAEAIRLTGLTFRRSRKRYRHPDYPFLVAHVDGIRSDAVLECKTTTSRMLSQYGNHGDLIEEVEGGLCPPSHFFQMQWYMLLTKKPVCYYAVGVLDNREVRVLKCVENRASQAEILSRALSYWADVQSGNEPELMFAVDFDHKYPEEQQDLREASPDEEHALQEYAELKRERGQYDEQIKKLETFLKSRVADHAGLQSSSGKVLCTWKVQERSSLDTKQLKEQHPDLVEALTCKSQHRVFRSYR